MTPEVRRGSLLGRRAQLKTTGETGVIIQVINRCYWVRIEGRLNLTLSGGHKYWKLLPREGKS